MDHVALAYCFDEAVGMFGGYIEGKLDERDKKGKLLHKLSTLLGVQPKAHKLSRREVEAFFGPM